MANPSTSPIKILAVAVMLVGLAAGTTPSIANPGGGRSVGRSFAAAPAVGGGYGGYGGGYSGYGGGYYAPYAGGASYYQGNSNEPSHWWTGPNGSNDPIGEGYNPNAGYAWDTVSTLLLDTNPPKARVTLDGIYVGTTDSLGPFQLPAGDHTLKIEAAGFEPSETVLKVEKPVVQQLQVNLVPVSHGNKPAPAK